MLSVVTVLVLVELLPSLFYYLYSHCPEHFHTKTPSLVLSSTESAGNTTATLSSFTNTANMTADNVYVSNTATLAKYMKLEQKGKVLAEYIWIDGSNGLRNKTKVSTIFL